MAADPFGIAQAATQPALFDEFEMGVAGGEIDAPRLHGFAVARFRHMRDADAVEAFGEAGGEDGGHVLGDQSRRAVGGELREQGQQRLDAAGGGADRHHKLAGGEGGARLGGRGRRARCPDP
jgi:hypothetical protein